MALTFLNTSGLVDGLTRRQHDRKQEEAQVPEDARAREGTSRQGVSEGSRNHRRLCWWSDELGDVRSWRLAKPRTEKTEGWSIEPTVESEGSAVRTASQEEEMSAVEVLEDRTKRQQQQADCT